MSIIEWMDEGLPRSVKSTDIEAEVEEIVARLMEQPGKWAKIESYPDDPNKAHRRRDRIIKHAPTQVQVTVQIPDVFARYMVDDSHGGRDESGEGAAS